MTSLILSPNCLLVYSFSNIESYLTITWNFIQTFWSVIFLFAFYIRILCANPNESNWNINFLANWIKYENLFKSIYFWLFMSTLSILGCFKYWCYIFGLISIALSSFESFEALSINSVNVMKEKIIILTPGTSLAYF